jgi:hypothetical protein
MARNKPFPVENSKEIYKKPGYQHGTQDIQTIHDT